MDDSETVLEVTREVLEEGGYDVVTLSSAALLPNVWNSERPDLALIDVSMPVIEGNSVVELMRRSSLHQCPLVLYSDQPEARLEALAQACGASGFLRKTSDGAQLLKSVARFLGQALPAPSASPSGGALLVFVVEAEASARAATEAVLRGAGCEPVGLAGCEECLVELNKRRPALILMDLALMPLGGDACCRSIRENRVWNDIPLVITSLSSSTVDVMRVWRAGADDFLKKPLAGHELLARVEVAREAAAQGPRPPPSAQGGLLLLADGHSFFRNRLGAMLERSGFRMIYARNIEEALAACAQHGGELQAALLDLELPGAPASAVLQTMKRTLAGPVLAMSSQPGPAKNETELLTGHQVVDKRLPCENVVSQVNKALRRQQNLLVADRMPFFSLVEFRALGAAGWRSGFSYDLSANGIFLTTLTTESPGSQLELRLAWPGAGMMHCKGRVAWANSFVRRATFSYMVGMGVDLTSADPATRALLERYTATARAVS